jgi:Ferritin-like domain
MKVKEKMAEGLGRRNFLLKAGAATAGFTGLGLLAGIDAAAGTPAQWEDEWGCDPRAKKADTAQQIFTAALIAEDLATTMYYNSLVGAVIQDPNLAGPGGSLSNPANLANVGYLQGALSAEVAHANLLRDLTGGTTGAKDPVQTFYFPTGTFDTLANFLPILIALEDAFVGAYLTAVHEFSLMAARIDSYECEQKDPAGKAYTRSDLAYYAQVASAIQRVESEHRTLARAIPSISLGSTEFAGINLFPADNLTYEQTDGLKTVYNGPDSAVVALTPFITPGSGKTAFRLEQRLRGQEMCPCRLPEVFRSPSAGGSGTAGTIARADVPAVSRIGWLEKLPVGKN